MTTFRWTSAIAICIQCERKLRRNRYGEWEHVWTDPLSGAYDARKILRDIDRDDHDADPEEDAQGRPIIIRRYGRHEKEPVS